MVANERGFKMSRKVFSSKGFAGAARHVGSADVVVKLLE